jgi:guanylate kinase
MTHFGNLFIISAASGAGKTSLVKSIIKQVNNIELSISYTTRARRSHEQEGVDYFFINQETFLLMKNNGEFLESAKVFDNYYATSKLIVQNSWPIDVKGHKIPCVSVFILPPSLQSLSERLLARGQDKLETIKKRLSAVKKETEHYVNYDYLIINDDFDRATQDLAAIINAQRLTTDNQKIVYASLINSLLA